MQLSQRAQSWARSASVALVVATLVVVPLLTPPEPWAWKGTKQLLFQLMMLVGLGLALWQSDPAAGTKGWRRVLGGPNLPALLLVLLGGISLLATGGGAAGTSEFLRLACGVGLYFVVAAFFRSRDRMQLLADVLVGVVILATLVGFVNYRSEQHGTGAFIASFGNRELIAGFLVLLTPMMLALPLADLTPGRKIAAQVAAVLACAAMLLAQGRSAWIGTLVSLVVLAAMVLKLRDGRKGGLQQFKEGIIVPVLPIAGATGLFLGLSRTTPEIGDRAASLTAPGKDVSWAERQQQWRGALKMIQQRPLFGWGIGSYPVQQARFVSGSLPAAVIAKRGPSLLEMAHNEYLQLTAELGIVGLLIYLALLGAFFTTAIRGLGKNRSTFTRVILMGAIAGVVGQMVDAVANPAWRFVDVSLFFWAILGLGVAAARHGVKEKADLAVESLPTARRSLSPVRLGWQGAVACIVAGLIYQAGAAGSASPIPEYLRPRSAFVRPPNGIVFQGTTIQARLLVRFVNGQFVELTGPCPGLSWQILASRGGPPSTALQEVVPGSGLLRASTDDAFLGKTFVVRGFYTSNGATVAGLGRVKIPIPFGRTAGLRHHRH